MILKLLIMWSFSLFYFLAWPFTSNACEGIFNWVFSGRPDDNCWRLQAAADWLCAARESAAREENFKFSWSIRVHSGAAGCLLWLQLVLSHCSASLWRSCVTDCRKNALFSTSHSTFIFVWPTLDIESSARSAAAFGIRRIYSTIQNHHAAAHELHWSSACASLHNMRSVEKCV